MRIIFLGDSLTWGGYGGNFVDVVAQLMPEHDIINAGVGGDTAINIERRLDDELAEHQPDARGSAEPPQKAGGRRARTDVARALILAAVVSLRDDVIDVF